MSDICQRPKGSESPHQDACRQSVTIQEALSRQAQMLSEGCGALCRSERCASECEHCPSCMIDCASRFYGLLADASMSRAQASAQPQTSLSLTLQSMFVNCIL